MNRRFAGLVLGCLAISVASGSELTLATYNVENYTATNRVTAVGYRRDYPKSEKAKAALRRVIAHMDADVIVLQEMGPRSYLNELQRDLRSEGLDYPYAHLAEAKDEVRHVAMLSKQPWLRVQTHADLDFKYFEGREVVKRGLLEAVFETPEGEVTLWSMHLKSRYADRKDDPDSVKRRAGEATAIRNFIQKRFPDPEKTHYLIMGDFNDVKRSASVRYMKKRGSHVISRLLSAKDSRGDHWTYHYHRTDTYSRVDHALVSLGLYDSVKGREARIFDGVDVEAASDHRPIMVTLEFGD